MHHAFENFYRRHVTRFSFPPFLFSQVNNFQVTLTETLIVSVVIWDLIHKIQWRSEIWVSLLLAVSLVKHRTSSARESCLHNITKHAARKGSMDTPTLATTPSVIILLLFFLVLLCKAEFCSECLQMPNAFPAFQSFPVLSKQFSVIFLSECSFEWGCVSDTHTDTQKPRLEALPAAPCWTGRIGRTAMN